MILYIVFVNITRMRVSEGLVKRHLRKGGGIPLKLGENAEDKPGIYDPNYTPFKARQTDLSGHER